MGFDNDGLKWRPAAHVEKWDADQAAWVRRKSGLHAPCAADFHRLGVKPVDFADDEGNLLTTVGLNRIGSLIIAGGGQGLSNTATRLGVGNGAGSAAVGDTDLGAAAGSANRWFQIMDATFPSQSNGVISAKATFASGDGNFAWNEWGLDVGTPTVTSGATVNSPLINHKTSAALGTKTAGAVWALTVTITLA